MQAPAANVKWSLIFKFMTWMALYEKLVSFPDTQCVCCTKGLGMRPMKNYHSYLTRKDVFGHETRMRR